MSTGTAPISAQDAQPLSQVARVVNTFIAPSKTFTDIRRSASWWVPWLLISLFSIAFFVVIDKKIGFEQVVRNEIARSPRAQAQMERLPAEQRERGVSMQVTITKVSTIYASPVLVLLFALLIPAAVLLAAFNFGAGAELKFGTVMAIVSYANLPGIIGALLGIVSLMAGVNPEGFSIKNPVASNLAYFMDPAGNKFLYGLASGVDVFVIWTIVLLGIGFSTTSKVKKGTSFAIVIGLYVAYKLIASGLGAAFA